MLHMWPVKAHNTITSLCNILRYLTTVKMVIFRKNRYFLIFAKNIDCGYTLEPPYLVLSSTHNLCLEKKENQRTNGPVNAHLISCPSKAQNMENIW